MARRLATCCDRGEVGSVRSTFRSPMTMGAECCEKRVRALVRYGRSFRWDGGR